MVVLKSLDKMLRCGNDVAQVWLAGSCFLSSYARCGGEYGSGWACKR